jgi:acetyl/propionyl-CoA carboxylase alpha subunit
MIYYAKLKDSERRIEIRKDGSTYSGEIDGRPFTADARLIDGVSAISLIVNKKCYEVIIVRAGKKLIVSTGGDEFEIELSDELEHRSVGRAATASESGLEEVRAPMPGVVVALEVKPGERIAPGSPVVIVEAMKMQNEISTLAGGVVKSILVKAGDVVESQQTLVILDNA